MSFRLRSLIPLLCLAGALVFAGDDLKDLQKTLKNTAYGNYWNRLDACTALEKIGTKEAAALLIEVLKDAQPEIREKATLVLGKFKDKQVLAWIAATTLAAPEELTRKHGATAIGLAEAKDLAPALAKSCAGDRSAKVRAAAAGALALLGGEEAETALVGRLNDSAAEVRIVAAEGLATLKAKGAAGALTEALKDRDAEARGAIARALGAVGGKEAVAALEPLTADKEPAVRIGAVDGLVDADPEAATAAILKGIDAPEWSVRAAVIAAARRIRVKESVDALVARLEKETGRLRLDIVLALRDLTGKEIGFDARDWKIWWENARESFKIPPKKGGKGLVEDGPPPSGGSAAAFFNLPILSDRIAFIIDMSGSMKTAEEKKVDGSHTKDEEKTTKLDIAKEELAATLKSLKDKVHFNIVLMNTEFAKGPQRRYVKALVPATEANKTAAMKWFESAEDAYHQATRGRGDLYDAIAVALQDPEVDTLFVLSDGVPTAGEYVASENIYDAIRRSNRSRRVAIHTILTGSKGTDQKFMKNLAAVTGGLFVSR